MVSNLKYIILGFTNTVVFFLTLGNLKYNTEIYSNMHDPYKLLVILNITSILCHPVQQKRIAGVCLNTLCTFNLNKVITVDSLQTQKYSKTVVSPHTDSTEEMALQ